MYLYELLGPPIITENSSKSWILYLNKNLNRGDCYLFKCPGFIKTDCI